MGKILEVKHLSISFRTPGGILHAVRDISFDLERGETLSIVGESGSGKSVTSKAILGILAGNSIVESGEILYDGRDLLRIPETEMVHIRGDKISMIFQDPLSSLNPIVKIGHQITEAMLLKNKVSRKEARAEFNELLAVLREHMVAAVGGESAPEAARVKEMAETFDRFNIEGIKYENAYNIARTSAEDLISQIDDFCFLAEKHQKLDVPARLKEITKRLGEVKAPFFTTKYDETISALQNELSAAAPQYKTKGVQPVGEMPAAITDALGKIRACLDEILAQTRPNFFRIGYYMMKNPTADLGAQPVEEVNEMALKYLNEDFMNEYLRYETAGVRHSFTEALEKKKAVLPELAAAKTYFAGDFEKKAAEERAKTLSDAVEASIDRLETNKDSVAYTFRSSLSGSIAKYFAAVVNNPKEEARFERQSRRREALIARGKTVDWKVVPKTVYDLGMLKEEIIGLITRLEEKYKAYIAAADTVDLEARSIDLIDHFKDKASGVVYRVTKRMAREKAIKLMDEVGIPDSRIRYNQYPFEFSGGMRQRIVIAIALAADPDILICDEPTTALDVTIQAQILELINKLKAERRLSVIFITHDLGVVANMADRIAVMYAGKIVEFGTSEDIFYRAAHPYTWALLSSMPDLDTNEKLEAIPGTPPNMVYPPVGDAFAARNKYALKVDFERQPPLFRITDTHSAATWLLHPDAPHVDPPKIITDRIARMKKMGGAGNAE